MARFAFLVLPLVGNCHNISLRGSVTGGVGLSECTYPTAGDVDTCKATANYCGGAKGDSNTELSCTPYPYKSSEAPPFCADPSGASSYGCKAGALADFAGDMTSDAGDYVGALAWYDWNQAEDDSNKNYWVFHACDGAGVMDDCAGFTWYVEQIGPIADVKNWPMPAPNNEDDPHRICNYEWSECAFQHPGTETPYEWYKAGMMSTDMWADQSAHKEWWGNMGLPDAADITGGDSDTIVAIMYPWVCNSAGDDHGWLWGELTPFGDATRNIHCYYDNEPGCCKGQIPEGVSCTTAWEGQCPPDEHSNSVTPPPNWEAMRFWKNNEKCEVWGWVIAESKGTTITSYWDKFDPDTPGFILKVKANGCDGEDFKPW